jgi:hydroxymethylbilane synthase
MLHAVGQGALGIESRNGDQAVAELLSRIGCDRTTRAVLAERQLMRTLEGGCSVPIGVETRWTSKSAYSNAQAGVGSKPADVYDQLTGTAKSESNSDSDLSDELILNAIVVSLDGQDAVEIETRKVVTTHEQANDLGFEAAKLLVDKGADKILEKVQLNRGIIKEQGNA